MWRSRGTSTRVSEKKTRKLYYSAERQQQSCKQQEQLWQWAKGEGDRKINIILETLMIHFLSHVCAYSPPLSLLEFTSFVTGNTEKRVGVLLALRFGLPRQVTMCSLSVTAGESITARAFGFQLVFKIALPRLILPVYRPSPEEFECPFTGLPTYLPAHDGRSVYNAIPGNVDDNHHDHNSGNPRWLKHKAKREE